MSGTAVLIGVALALSARSVNSPQLNRGRLEAAPIQCVAIGDAEPSVIREVGLLNRKAISLPRPRVAPSIRGTARFRVVVDLGSGQVVWARAVAGPPALVEAASTVVCSARFALMELVGDPARVGGELTYTFGARKHRPPN